MDTLHSFLNGDYMPHGYCFSWHPGILWTSVISDLMIAAAYFSIPMALVLIIRKKKDWKFHHIFWMFAAFILLCGMTHLFAIFTLWNGYYGVHALLKAVTAAVSMATAVFLYQNIPAMIALPTQVQLDEANKAVTDEKLRNQELELINQSNVLIKAAVDFMPNGIAIFDEDEKMLTGNQAFIDIFDNSEQSVRGTELSKLFDFFSESADELKNYFFPSLDESFRDTESQLDSLVKIKNDTADRLFQLKVSKIKEFRVQRYLVSLHAVDKVLQEKDLLFSGAQRVFDALNSGDSGLWELNPNTGEAWFSKQMVNILPNVSDSHLAYGDWRTMVHEEDLGLFDKSTQNVEDKIDFAYRHKMANDYRWYRVRGNVSSYASKQNVLLSGTLTNIDPIKKAEIRLQESNEDLERFAYAASHDLQEPLRKISGFSGSLKQRLGQAQLDSNSLYELDRMEDAAKRMSGMIRSLLEVSRINKTDLKRGSVSLLELVEEARADLQTADSETELDITVQGDPTLNVDKPLMATLFKNLFLNSIKHSGLGGRVKLKVLAQQDQGKLIVQVSDNGKGIPIEYRNEIFAPFKKLDTEKTSGYGIGLAICRQIAKAHGGQIVLDGESQGASFKLELGKA